MEKNIPLNHFEIRESDDPAKADQELWCKDCETLLCDVQHQDTLEVLVNVANEHDCDEN